MSTTDFKNILVATDFSEHAAHALEVAVALAKKLGAKITLVHAHYLPPVAYDSGVVWPIEEFEIAARKEFERQATAAREQYRELESVFEIGYPSDIIIAAARRVAADMIVMGTHGRRGLSRMLLGSVAEKVVRSSAVPVLTVSLSQPSG